MTDTKSTIVGFVNSSQSWGGGEKWHYEAARDLRERGYTVYFFCKPGSEIAKHLQQSGVATLPLTISNLSFLNPRKIWLLSKSLRLLGITALLLNSPADVKLAAPAAKMAGVANIIFRRGMPHPISANILNKWLFRKVVDRVIANSQAVADSLDQSRGGIVPSGKVAIVENGMLFDDSTTAAPLELAGQTDIIIGTAGRMVKQKNQRFLVDVANLLQQRQLNFQMIIAGTGKLEGELKQAVADLKLQSRVMFPGFVQDIRSLHAITDIFVFPSLFEGSSNTLIEAAGHGLPVVASDIRPNREILPDDSLGRLVPLGDTEGFADAIMELAANRNLRENIGQAARASIRDRFNLQKAREKLIALL